MEGKAVVVTLEAYHLTLNLPKKISKEAYSVLQYPKVYDTLKARRQFYYSLLELSQVSHVCEPTRIKPVTRAPILRLLVTCVFDR